MKNLAIFDLDHTLINTDSDNEFPKFLIEKGLLDAEEAAAKNEQFYQDYLNGCLKIEDFVAFEIEPIRHLNRTQLDELHREFVETHIKPHISNMAQMLVRGHREAGDELLVISSTNEFVITPICHLFGITNIIGTQLEVDADGYFTGKVVGVPSLQGGKITRLDEWLMARGETLADYSKTYFYSDSHNDLPLLEAVDEAVAVNPDDELLAHAKKRGWVVLNFM
ncbi:HAD family hydrolase [Wielerella bovis]|uniref:HAD family hydrolase n=1 Tax=Wielerella bovis TaxID=2917790 RepID=UPI002018729F|nr:HAD family hydrolase [Wielerella bovis]ULJ62179.1 HAD-IB family hydrolase [Wielerella bovis]ULJ64411.1 HAD-IB family hydrolase [Wielerella bovis]ULJ66690.1 HAD-IB family hydrolase [Wielerella bovis]